MSWLRFLAQLHGHVGYLAVASLLHPALLLRRGRGGGIARIATALTLGTFGFGMALYPSYRADLKRAIFLGSPAVGWAFERKEHLAFGAAALSVLGLVAAALGLAKPDADPRYLVLARRAYAAAFVLALAVALIGTWVTSVRSFLRPNEHVGGRRSVRLRASRLAPHADRGLG